MNILIVGTDVSKYGSPMSMAVLAGELIRMNHRVICVIPQRGPIEEILREKGIPYRIIGVKKWIAEPQRTAHHILMKYYRMCMNVIAEARLMKLCRKYHIEIIHLNTCASPCGYFCSRVLNLKLVWHIREFVEEDFGYQFYHPRKALHKISKADAIITISDALYRKYKAVIPKEKISLIYNGIDEKIYYRKESIFTGPQKVIAHIGRFHENKGQAEFLEACRYYEENSGTLPFRVWIIGGGDKEYVDYLEKKAADLKSDVEFMGFSDHIEELLPLTDIVVVNSKCEAFGRVTVEAMMAGRLVIGSKSGAIPEIIGEDCGLLYEYGDAVQLAETISYALMHEKEMREIAARGRDRALMLFGSERNAREISNLYYKLKK